MIKQETIRSIIDTAQIDDVVSDFVTLKKRGANYLGLCPFHNEKTPSFTVSPTKGIYKCFGCGKAGDVIRFMMEHDQLTYPEALRFLAAKYNIEIEEEFKGEKQIQEESLRESLLVVNSFAIDHFEKNLWESEKGKAIALSYFLERGFDEKTIKHFRLGYAIDESSEFSNAAKEAGHNIEFLEKTGLTIVKGENHYDRFRGRVIFPIHNLSGRVIGFGGRTLKSDKNTAKYVNSPESEVYSKSFQLYGLYFAKKSMVKEDVVYLVEGYTDVVSLFQSGIENAVAPLGTSLTEDQIKLIQRYTKNVVLLFDGDQAGIKASLRAIDMLLKQGLGVKVVSFPEGQDPDSYSKAHSDEELKDFLNNHQEDFIEFQLRANKEKWDGDPMMRAGLMKEIIQSISEIPDHLLRSLYVRKFSQIAELDEKSIIFELNRTRKIALKKQYHQEVLPDETEKFSQHNVEAKEKLEVGWEHKEQKVIELLFKFGTQTIKVQVKNEEQDEAEDVEITVSDYIVGELSRDQLGFQNQCYAKIFDVYCDFVERGETPGQREFLEHPDDEIREMSYELVSSKHILSENWWEKYHIDTSLEENNLKQSIDRALYSFKLSVVLNRLQEFEEKLKGADEEEMQRLLLVQKNLSEAKKALANKLGMTLT